MEIRAQVEKGVYKKDIAESLGWIQKPSAGLLVEEEYPRGKDRVQG
jgi:hypothetical protein